MFVSVVIDNASSNVDQYFEYAVQNEFASFVKVGERVSVPFGQSNKPIMGYIIEVYENSKFGGQSKYIFEVLDFKPVLSEEQIKLALYIKDECVCPLIRVLNLMIPKALRVKTYKYIEVLSYNNLDASLIELFGGLLIIEYTKKYQPYYAKIKKEIDKGNLRIYYDTKQVASIYYEKRYCCDKDVCNKDYNQLRSEKKRTFIDEFMFSDPITKNQIMDRYGVSLYLINDLIKKRYIYEVKVKTSRVKERTIPTLVKDDDGLFEDVENRLWDKDIPSLYIPKSTTELDSVIARLTNTTLKNDRNVVIVCADILSSLKYSSLLRKKFNIDVACINSNIGDGEYLDYYLDICDNRYPVVVTTPVGAFLPYSNVGLYIVLDEESDNYFNDQSPRYDLRKLVYCLSRLNKCKLIYESLCPDVSYMCYGLKGNFDILEGKNNELPNIEVVNLRDELLKGNASFISNSLYRSMADAMAANKQTLLIVNNKSFANYVICRSCGDVPKCDRCGLSMQYNEKRNELVCPACGSRTPFSGKCNKCDSTSLRFGGIGIESMAKEVFERFKYARILAIDSNDNYDEFLSNMNDIEDGSAQVIITTETYAKALVDENIALVGVVNFDSVLKTPTYDANSRAYSLLVNACSHLKKDGKLIIQTTQVDNPVLKYMIVNDYNGFLKEEVKLRKASFNEPFYKVNRIIVKAKYEEMFKVANNIKLTLKELAGNKLFIIGPTYSKRNSGVVLIIKHNYKEINDVYKKIYEHYQSTTTQVIFDKYPRML